MTILEGQGESISLLSSLLAIFSAHRLDWTSARISLETAIYYVQKNLTRYRLPEPTRLADKLSKNPDILLV
jgi:hypothetical protein